MSAQHTEEVDEAVVPEPHAPSSRALGWLLVVGGAFGLVASAILTVERILLLEDPGYTPSCSFNPLVSCGQVMESWQGSLFGPIPNPLIGIAAFAVVVTIGVVVLTGARLPRWVWVGFWAGTLLGAVFITWLFTQSVYLIGALCPYCMVVWVATIPIFVYTSGYALAEGHLGAPAGLRRAIVANRGLIVTMWYLIMAALIVVAFWDRWYLVF